MASEGMRFVRWLVIAIGLLALTACVGVLFAGINGSATRFEQEVWTSQTQHAVPVNFRVVCFGIGAGGGIPLTDSPGGTAVASSDAPMVVRAMDASGEWVPVATEEGERFFRRSDVTLTPPDVYIGVSKPTDIEPLTRTMRRASDDPSQGARLQARRVDSATVEVALFILNKKGGQKYEYRVDSGVATPLRIATWEGPIDGLDPLLVLGLGAAFALMLPAIGVMLWYLKKSRRADRAAMDQFMRG